MISGVQVNRLNVQYRMHPALSRFPSYQFYEGSLVNGIKREDRRLNQLAYYWLKTDFPLMWCQSSSEEKKCASGHSYENFEEVVATSNKIESLLNQGIRPEQIGVITPYSGQKALINAYLRSSYPKNVIGMIDVCSVDGFPGREKDIIIISAVRSNKNKTIGFLKDRRRLNVALTRAKYGLILIGNQSILEKGSLWKNLIDYIVFYIEKFVFNTNNFFI